MMRVLLDYVGNIVEAYVVEPSGFAGNRLKNLLECQPQVRLIEPTEDLRAEVQRLRAELKKLKS